MNYSLENLRNGNFTRLDKYSDNYIKSMLDGGFKVGTLLYGGNGVNLDYSGRGLIHTTWIDNYRSLSKFYNRLYSTKFDFTENPTLLVTDYKIATRSALIFFQKHKLFDTILICFNNYDYVYLLLNFEYYEL